MWVTRRGVLAVVAVLASAGVLVERLDVAVGATAPRAPRVQNVSLLYVLDAQAGTLSPVAGTQHRFVLTLKRVAPEAVWFEDRPAHRSGDFPSAAFAREWKGFGFGSRTPDAALVFHTGQPDGDTVIVSLSSPHFDKRHNTLSFAAGWVDPRTITTGNLAAHAKTADPTPPHTFKGAALFVSQTTAPVIGGCLIEPFTQCPYAELRDAHLSGANLYGANLELADLVRADLTFADLTHAAFTDADLWHADLRYADLTNAILVGADLTGAQFSGAHLDGANLTRANLSNALLHGAYFCRTTMPDGSQNNSDC